MKNFLFKKRNKQLTKFYPKKIKEMIVKIQVKNFKIFLKNLKMNKKIQIFKAQLMKFNKK